MYFFAQPKPKAMQLTIKQEKDREPRTEELK